MSHEELRKLLTASDKASRKALSSWATELEEEDPQLCADLLSVSSQEEAVKGAMKKYRVAKVLSRISMILAVLAVMGAYLISDFALGLLEGVWNRYCMAMGIILSLSIFAGGSLLFYRRKEQLLVTAYLALPVEETQE
ncbi:MAG: hypothetical protein IKT58_05280 [Oscillospiraceae bacterium]|nr:hypothetical protein [Oscillospiraceae bacterium]